MSEEHPLGDDFIERSEARDNLTDALRSVSHFSKFTIPEILKCEEPDRTTIIEELETVLKFCRAKIALEKLPRDIRGTGWTTTTLRG